jgi:hypothetical protein
MTNKEADEILTTWLNKLADGQAPKELQLDVFDAVRLRASGNKPQLIIPLKHLASSDFQYDEQHLSLSTTEKGR